MNMEPLDLNTIVEAWPFLMQGLWFSVKLTLFAFTGALTLGVLLAIARHLHLPVLSQLALGYTTLIRSLPLVLVLFWFFFLVPIFLEKLHLENIISITANGTAFITFTLFEAAYYAEIIRAQLNSLPKEQYEASKALGFSDWHMYRHVIIPQVFRMAAPILLTQTVILFQDTSLVYVLSLTDLLGAATKMAQRDSTLIELYLTTAFIYFFICTVASEAIRYLTRTRLPILFA